MIAVIYGTTGELIKLSPILMRLDQMNAPAFTLCTGQQVEQIPALLDDFGLPQPSVWLAHGNRYRDLERPQDLLPWFFDVCAAFARHRRMLRGRFDAATTKPLLTIHGDTLTTVLGGLIGHALRVPVAHIEAGMRSGDWRNPFPEELDRLTAARLAAVHFAPGEHAAANLRAMKVRGEIVDTGANTIRDALALVPPRSVGIDLPREPFGLVSLHRFELLGKPAALRAILELLQEASRSAPVLFVDHPVTAAAIAAHGLDCLFDQHFRRIPRQPYFRFISLLKTSAFLVTDSGGSQQECAYLGHPCLVHRAVTEHDDGLDESVVLSRMDLGVARAFLEEPTRRAGSPKRASQSPTDVIIDRFERSGHLLPARVAQKTQNRLS
jgi:UDP-N-acetylglucosamine 2-epimerase (non-hydrolysing)